MQVWSDFKSNVKRKAARIYRSAHKTGGGPAHNMRLSDLEERVLTIMGSRAATGIIEIPEVGLEVSTSCFIIYFILIFSLMCV